MNKNRRLINLQLMSQNMNATTSSGLSPENKTFYDKVLLRDAKPNLVHDQFAQKRNIPKNGGKTIEFRKFASLPKALTPLTEGVTPDGSLLDVTAITATVSQYGDYVRITDVVKLTTIDNVLVESVSMLGDQAGRTLDTITRDAMAAGTNVIYAGGRASRATLTTSDKLTVQLIKKAATQLKRHNTPTIDGSYVGIVHPDVAYDLMNDEEFIEWHKYARPDDVPEKTIFIITTDGMENASRNYDYKNVKKMVERQKKKYHWEFIFLGANIDAIEVAGRFGVSANRAVRYECDSAGTALNFNVMSRVLSSARTCGSAEEMEEMLDKRAMLSEIESDYKKRHRG